MRRWLVVVGVAVVGAVVVCVGLTALGYGPIAVTETRHAPQAVRFLGPGGDPLVVSIGVKWTKDGYCSGQFTVQAKETATEIRVGTVVSREYRYGACAGLGTSDDMAWTELRLSSPPGDRTFVRDSDGATLPILSR